MKNIALILVLSVLMAACASTAKFPVSSITPAGTIIAKMKKDRNKNYVISITADHLASAERLSPPKKTYVIWITTKDNSVKNIGQLKNKNAKKSVLETLSSFEPVEIFITAEDEGNISSPRGLEISRTTFK
jgi:capsular polysaccharide biosynthesis protein